MKDTVPRLSDAESTTTCGCALSCSQIVLGIRPYCLNTTTAFYFATQCSDVGVCLRVCACHNSFVLYLAAVICVDALPRLPGGTACGVLVVPRAFPVVLTMSLESLILLCAWQRLGVVPFLQFLPDLMFSKLSVLTLF